MRQNARCFRRNETRFAWSNVFTSVIWRGAVTSDVTLSSCVTSGGVIPSSACNSWPTMTAICQVRIVLVHQQWPEYSPVNLVPSGIHWWRRTSRSEIYKCHSSNIGEWRAAVLESDTPTENRVAVGSEFCSAGAIFSDANCRGLSSGRTGWIFTFLSLYYVYIALSAEHTVILPLLQWLKSASVNNI